MYHTMGVGPALRRLMRATGAPDAGKDQRKPYKERGPSVPRRWLAGVAVLLLLAGGASAEEYKGAKITKAAGTAVTLSCNRSQPGLARKHAFGYTRRPHGCTTRSSP